LIFTFASRNMRRLCRCVAFGLSAAFCAYSVATESQEVQSTAPASGETVSELSKSICSVYQGKNNQYWFGSRGDGLYRYDGKSITRFTTKDGLPGNSVGGLQEDKAGNLYFTAAGQQQGFCKFDGKQFTAFKLPDSDSPAEAWKYQPDDLWFEGGQDTGVVYRYDGKTVHRLRFPSTKAGDDATLPRSKYPNAKYSPYDVYTIFKDSRGHMWFGTAILGACRYDGKSFAWISGNELGIDRGDAAFGVRSIIEDKDGKFWFTNTFNRYDVQPAAAVESGSGVRFRKEPGLGEKDPIEYFLSADKDKNGDLWLATLGGGVWRYDGTRLTHYPVTHNGEPIWVFGLYRDRQDGLWIGTQEHGVYKFNGKAFEKFRL
jgi:ligand-binding sensor domain-containing protein